MMNLRAPHLPIFGAIFVVVSYRYYPATNFAFLDGRDDPQYVTGNVKIKSLASGNPVRIFTSFDMGNYAPAHILSYASEYYFCLFRKIRGWFSGLVNHQAHDTKRFQPHGRSENCALFW
jgi:hypothetical protein